jgi:hypothetical protein
MAPDGPVVLLMIVFPERSGRQLSRPTYADYAKLPPIANAVTG